MIPRILCAILSAGLLLAQPAAAPDPGATARKALDLFLQQKYADLQQMFTPEVTKSIPAEELAKLGASMQAMGTPAVGTPQVSKLGSSTNIVLFPATYASGALTYRFVINSSGQIAGFLIARAAAPPVKWDRPAYSKPDAFTEREVTVGSDEWKLPGTLTVPVGKGPFPGVVLVQGSGAQDRDETIGGSKIFKDLAEGLASRGIVVLRFEKRTRQYQSKAAAMANLTIKEETLNDAGRALALLRTQSEVDGKRVYALGHSLGGSLAPRIAADDGKVAGVVIMAGDVRKTEDAILDQYAYVGASAADMETYRRQASKVKKLEAADADGPAVSIGNVTAPVSYWLSLSDYDALDEAKDLTIPMLILHGERDYQVTMKEFAGWKTALGSRKNVTAKSYPALNHLFEPGEGKSLPEEYAKPGHVAPEVIADIAKFMGK